MMALLRHQTVYLAIFVNPDKTFQVCPASFQHEIFFQHQRLLPCNQVGPSSPWLRLHQGPFPWLYCVESRKSMHNFRFFDPTFGVFLGFKFLGFPMRRRMNETTVARIINPWTILCKHVSIFDLQYIWNTVCYNYFNYILQWHEQIWNKKKLIFKKHMETFPTKNPSHPKQLQDLQGSGASNMSSATLMRKASFGSSACTQVPICVMVQFPCDGNSLPKN